MCDLQQGFSAPPFPSSKFHNFSDCLPSIFTPHSGDHLSTQLTENIRLLTGPPATCCPLDLKLAKTGSCHCAPLGPVTTLGDRLLPPPKAQCSGAGNLPSLWDALTDETLSLLPLSWIFLATQTSQIPPKKQPSPSCFPLQWSFYLSSHSISFQYSIKLVTMFLLINYCFKLSHLDFL